MYLSNLKKEKSYLLLSRSVDLTYIGVERSSNEGNGRKKDKKKKDCTRTVIEEKYKGKAGDVELSPANSHS